MKFKNFFSISVMMEKSPLGRFSLTVVTFIWRTHTQAGKLTTSKPLSRTFDQVTRLHSGGQGPLWSNHQCADVSPSSFTLYWCIVCSFMGLWARLTGNTEKLPFKVTEAEQKLKLLKPSDMVESADSPYPKLQGTFHVKLPPQI